MLILYINICFAQMLIIFLPSGRSEIPAQSMQEIAVIMIVWYYNVSEISMS